MIRKFVNRKSELEFLESAYEKKGLQVIVMYGRRRVGKTELIKKFIENKDAIYFLADQRGSKKNIERFVGHIQEHFNLPPLRIDSFEDAFKLIAEKSNGNRVIIVIDEFSYLIEREPALASVFQFVIDEILKKMNVFLIFCGSSISMMEKGVLSYKSPLYGRRTGQIKLTPIKFKDLKEFFPKYSIKQLIEVYSILGGIPAYLNLFNPDKDVFENIKETFLVKEHLLYQEPEIILREELREPRVYFNLLEAMANGKTKLTDIANKAGMNAKDVTSYINSLIELDIVKKTYLVTEKKPKSKKTLYFLKDNFFTFWFRFILVNREKIERGQTKVLLGKIENELPEYVSKKFEEVCIGFLWERPPFTFTRIGKWWGSYRDKQTNDRKNVEIDIVALNDETKEILFGECKWQDKKVDLKVIESLKEKSKLVDWNKDKRKEYFAVFSKSGFTPSCLNYCRENRIMTFDLKSMECIFK
ncbi:MAG: ATP-binding protein [Candidatus Thermoplasmatota archaeon]|nr:ATP-binding protein [Candidatus Thermoplasmatota archaeon]